VLEQVAEIGVGVGFAVAFGECTAVSGHQVPPSAAGGERVGCDDLDTRLHQVGPVDDVLGVALAGGDDDDGVGDEPVVLILIPTRRHDLGVDQPLHVGLERELDDVSFETGGHCAALVAGGPIGLGELDVLAGRRGLEGLDDLFVRRLRRGVGDQAQLDRAATAGGSRRTAAAGQRQEARTGQGYACDEPTLTQHH
jgi:hypothetical protein